MQRPQSCQPQSRHIIDTQTAAGYIRFINLNTNITTPPDVFFCRVKSFDNRQLESKTAELS